MRPASRLIFASLLVSAVPAWSNGGGGMSMPQRMPEMRQPSPEEQARSAYNDGVRYAKKADKALAASLEAKDAGKKDKQAKESQELYARALDSFKQAAELNFTMPEAWNYVGYTSRKLGHYEDALAAYDKALSLKPGYTDALEYRGEAFLAMNRISDAQQAYLDLYAGDRALAGKLLTVMKGWLATQRANPAGTALNLDDVDKWIQERAQIAGQTAALTRAGTASAWR